jgi:nucleotide-binding universal stress UspA family protein
MFNHVIIGIDEHQGGRDAIALAQDLVAKDGRLTLAYVHAGYTLGGRGSNADFEAAERDRAMKVLDDAAEEAGIDADKRCIGSTSVGRGLHELAERTGADLLVVGSTRHGLLGRVLIGDDTRAALNGAPCAVAIAPAGHERDRRAAREIGVAYNGSIESEHALRVARALAAERGARLSAFEAVSLPMYVFAGVPVPTEGDVSGLVDAARERIEQLGDVEAHAAYGHPAEELTLYGASLDLLIIGSRDYGPLGRLVHGSTARELARSSRCPLLVLTRAARAHDETTSDQNERHAAVA